MMLHATIATLHHFPSQVCRYTLHTPKKERLKITEEELVILKHQAHDDITEVPQVIMKGLK